MGLNTHGLDSSQTERLAAGRAVIPRKGQPGALESVDICTAAGLTPWQTGAVSILTCFYCTQDLADWGCPASGP